MNPVRSKKSEISANSQNANWTSNGMNFRLMNRGFTVIEILFAVFIMALVLAIVLVSLSKLNSSQALDKSATLVASILDEARSLTLSAKSDSQYGVYFEASQIVLFKGDTYLPLDPGNVLTSLNSLVGLRNITLSGGGKSVIFKRLSGNTDQAGRAEIFLKGSPGTFRVVTIGGTGVVELD